MDDIISISVNISIRVGSDREGDDTKSYKRSWINSLRLTTTSIMEMPLIMTH
jgi:hypothetical protein